MTMESSSDNADSSASKRRWPLPPRVRHNWRRKTFIVFLKSPESQTKDIGEVTWDKRGGACWSLARAGDNSCYDGIYLRVYPGGHECSPSGFQWTWKKQVPGSDFFTLRFSDSSSSSCEHLEWRISAKKLTQVFMSNPKTWLSCLCTSTSLKNNNWGEASVLNQMAPLCGMYHKMLFQPAFKVSSPMKWPHGGWRLHGVLSRNAA